MKTFFILTKYTMASPERPFSMRQAREAEALGYFDKRKPSYLPYYITRHRHLARRRLHHARSKEHALKHIDIRKGWLALFWIVVFLVVMTILCYLLMDILSVYVSHPIATQILTENEPLLFPDVTICPVSPVSYGSNSSLEKLNEIKDYVTQKLKYAGLPTNDKNIEAALLIQLYFISLFPVSNTKLSLYTNFHRLDNLVNCSIFLSNFMSHSAFCTYTRARNSPNDCKGFLNPRHSFYEKSLRKQRKYPQ
ncbi:unnamed protein product [Rodentolepis nana]|uniref:Amiloride-sensitive sodium channel subunit alpha n=1 Tax=Rodentolepis nana TaxID=102285 RepID=A0A0R3TY47_RODNA|nr:unnamed protein product [Rodentolepis nana]